ncbi:MAG: nuclear transport factor 2 family protein [Gammaproteobacteria bacterium]|nr:nuclear transport factor 2 family protein [Gammaproteobacteria bacterium]
MQKKLVAVIAATAGVLLGAGFHNLLPAATAADPAPSWMAVADRIAIEDLVVRYYAHLGGTSAESFGEYFTEDGMFEVNGDVYHGRKEIVALYAGMGGGVTADEKELLHMVLSNPVIEVNGDTAVASFLWTGIMNGTNTAPPRIREQGREYDRLVKRNGKWLIAKRVVIADSGLPESMLDTWQRKLDYDISRD